MGTRRLLYFKASHPHPRKKEKRKDDANTISHFGNSQSFFCDQLSRFFIMPSWSELDQLLLSQWGKLRKQESSDRKGTRKRGKDECWVSQWVVSARGTMEIYELVEMFIFFPISLWLKRNSYSRLFTGLCQTIYIFKYIIKYGIYNE